MTGVDVLNDKVAHCHRVVAFVREWSFGRGSDVFVLYAVNQNVGRYCSVSIGSGKEKVLYDGPFSANEFESLVGTIRSLQAFDIKSQDDPLIMTHFNERFIIKINQQNVSFSVPGGRHADERACRLRESILACAPVLTRHFLRSQR